MECTRFQAALYILICLGYNRDCQMSSAEFAKGLRTNPAFVRRILSLLVKANLVETTKGRQGGVMLKKNPQDITLYQVYSSVSLPDIISDIKKPPLDQCPVSCSMSKIMSDISNQIESSVAKTLSKTKLSHLIKSV